MNALLLFLAFFFLFALVCAGASAYCDWLAYRSTEKARANLERKSR